MTSSTPCIALISTILIVGCQGDEAGSPQSNASQSDPPANQGPDNGGTGGATTAGASGSQGSAAGAAGSGK